MAEEEEQYFTIDDLLAEDDGQQVQTGGAIRSVREAAVQTSEPWSNHLKQARSAKTNRQRTDELHRAARKTAAETEASLRSEILAAQARADRAEDSSRALRDELSARLEAAAAEAGRQRVRAERAELELEIVASGADRRSGASTKRRVEPEPEPEPGPEQVNSPTGLEAPMVCRLDPQSQFLREACLISAGKLQQACGAVLEAATNWPSHAMDRGSDTTPKDARASDLSKKPAASGWKAIRLGQHAETVARAAAAAIEAANAAHKQHETALKESRRREAEVLARTAAAEAEVKLQQSEIESLHESARLSGQRKETPRDGDAGAVASRTLIALRNEVAMLSDALQEKLQENTELLEQAADLRTSKTELEEEILELRPGGSVAPSRATRESAAAAAVAAAEQKATDLAAEVAQLKCTLREAEAAAARLQTDVKQAREEKSRTLAEKQEQELLQQKKLVAAATGGEAKVQQLQDETVRLREQLQATKKEVEDAAAENEMLRTTIRRQEKEKREAGKKAGGGGGSSKLTL
eukprot:COSAG02_NODE_6971_length_3258_cov_2.134853_1_plen_526_part_00